MRVLSLLLIPIAALAADLPAQAPAPIDVHLSNFSFTPHEIAIESGRPYVLRLVNDSGGGHNFSAPSFFSASAVTADDRRLVGEGTIEVAAGQSIAIHLTAPPPATYKVKCTHALHGALGMKGTIIVR